MKKLLVVGGTGFIGYHVIKEAKKRGWKITSISLRKPNKKRFHKGVDYKQVDITNFDSLKKKININYDFVVNAGGYGRHPNFNREGEKLFNAHFLGTINLIKILLKKKIKRFIQIGSSAEYGKEKSPQNENSQSIPRTPYALAKFSCTHFLKNFNQINNFPSTILRFYLVYGPNQNRNRILPQVIDNCLKDKKFPTTKGDQYCDFCFIDDAVKAIFKAMSSKKINGEIINIGSGRPIKIRHVINTIHRLIGKGKPQFGKLKYNKDINMKIYPNIKKAKRVIDWTPKVNFIQGLKLTIESFKR